MLAHYGSFYIDGRWIEVPDAWDFTLVDPSNEQPFATVALGTKQHVDAAVAAARRAFDAFSATPVHARIALLQKIANELELREDVMMQAVSQEMGAPRSMKAHVRTGIDAFTQAANTLAGYEFETKLGNNIVRREPIGVCGLITAWNWPIQLICTKLAAALAAGCPVVWKPSEFTPLSALQLAQALHAAGVPAGVFNMVIGDGPTVGSAISSHAGIEMVSFTGSTRAGILVAQDAAPTVKRVAQELGGKSANIILDDADLAAAASWNVSRGFSNAGQSCHSPSRVLVQRAQLDTVAGLMREAAAGVKVGPPGAADTTMGPVVNKAQYERIQRFIQLGLDEGATLVCGGMGRPQGLEQGYFVKPTIFSNVTSRMSIAREEIFGPVLSVMAYDTEAQAIDIANDTPFGLGGYVFSGDRARALAVGRQMRAGRIFYNGAPSNNVAPMGGYKQSGNGREMGVFGLEEYLEVKALIGFD